MLKVIVCRDGQAVSDFAARDFADAIIQTYLCGHKDMEVRVANELARDAFVLRLMEEKLSPDEVEFYVEDVKLEFDDELGLEVPDGAKDTNLFADMADAILRIGWTNMRARKMAEKDRKDC
jgi:hypothetical protein